MAKPSLPISLCGSFLTFSIACTALGCAAHDVDPETRADPVAAPCADAFLADLGEGDAPSESLDAIGWSYGSDASDASDRSDAPHDATPSAAGPFVSEPPGIRLIDATPASSRGLVLMDTRFTEVEHGALFRQEWLARVRNDGSETLCAIEAHVSLQDGDDMERAGFDALADARPHDVGLASSAPCLPPHEIGAFFATTDVSDPVGPETVRSIVVRLTSIASLALPHPHAPSVDWMTAERLGGSDFYQLVGFVSAKAKVHDVVLHAYPIVSGVLRRRLVDTHPKAMSVDAPWNFSTTLCDAPFTDVLVFTAFIDSE